MELFLSSGIFSISGASQPPFKNQKPLNLWYVKAKMLKSGSHSAARSTRQKNGKMWLDRCTHSPAGRLTQYVPPGCQVLKVCDAVMLTWVLKLSSQSKALKRSDSTQLFSCPIGCSVLHFQKHLLSIQKHNHLGKQAGTSHLAQVIMLQDLIPTIGCGRSMHPKVSAMGDAYSFSHISHHHLFLFFLLAQNLRLRIWLENLSKDLRFELRVGLGLGTWIHYCQLQ